MQHKLKLEELKVESFATDPEAGTERRGTVRGFAGSNVHTCERSCDGARTCYFTCDGNASCPITCQNTCPFTCPGCW